MTENKPCAMESQMIDEVVITGLSGRLPESDNIAEFRENLINGIDMVTDDGRRWEPDLFGLPRRNGKLKDLTKFDAAFFGVHPKQANGMDPQLRMLLEVTYEALVDAGVNPQSVRGSSTGVFIGCSASEVHDAWTADADKVTGYEMTGCTRSMFANRLSYFFDFKGPSYAIDTACSSSLLALDQALRAIRSGQCEAAIVGGTSLCLRPSTSSQFQKLGMLSQDGACKSFDVSGNGYCRSEAIVAVYLQKRSSAQRVYATLIHSKNNSDGFKEQGITFPSGEMQKRLLLQVYGEAHVDPATVSYVELHGTGTHAGDPQEANSVAEVFCGPDRTTPLLIGSTKSNMGHPEPASGLAALAKVIIAMHGGAIPANLHYREPNPDIPALIDGRFKVVDELTPWTGGYVGINSFGFGGSNVHVLLRSADHMELHRTEHPAAAVPRLVTCCSRTKGGVEQILNEALQRSNDVELHSLLTSSVGEQSLSTHPYRGFALVNSPTSRQTVEKVSVEERPVWFVFAGMGTQWPKMGCDLMPLDAFRESIIRSNAVLESYGICLSDMLSDSNEETFNNTLNTFVVIAAIQVALVDVLKTLDIKPSGIIGHSVGELGCAYADGCMTAEETLLAAYWRGRCVKEANLPPGGMAAVGMTWEEAHRRCPEGVVPACHNSTDTVTISGPAAAVSKFVAELQLEGIFAKEVQSAGVAFHSYCMSQTADSLKERLLQVLKNPRPRTSRWVSSSVPKSNWSSELARYSSADYHVNNLVSPVLFQEALEHVPSNAIVVEIAPHSLLQAVLRRGLPGSCTIVGMMDKRQPDNMSHLLSTLGKLFLNGVNFNPLSLYPAVSRPVSNGTPMLSSLVQWDHSDLWAVPSAQDFIALGNGGAGSGSAGSFEIDISSPSSEDAYLAGHVIDGRVLFPATGYLVLAWKQLAKLNGQLFGQFPVTFENVSIHRATILPSSGSVKLDVNIAPGTGKFEVCENGTLVVSGQIHVSSEDDLESDPDEDGSCVSSSLSLDSNDIYKELRLRGYDYGPSFQGIASAAGNGIEGELLWHENWVTFLDALLQMQVLSLPGRDLRLPTRIRQLYISPRHHLSCVQTLSDGRRVIKARNNHELGTCTSGGVELLNLHATVAPRRQVAHAAPTLETHEFVPYVESDLISKYGSSSIGDYAEACVCFALQKIHNLVDTGSNNGLQNVELLRRLFSKERSTDHSLSSERLGQYLNEADCTVLKELDNIFKAEHDEKFGETIRSIASSAWSDIAVVDRLTSYIRSNRCFKACLDVVLENLSVVGSDTRIKVVECDAKIGQAYRHAIHQLSSQPAVSVNYFMADSNPSPLTDDELATKLGVQLVDWSLCSEKPVPDQVKKSDLVVLANVLHRQPNLANALRSSTELLSEGGFLIVVEPTANFGISWALFALANDLECMTDLASRSFGPFCDEPTWAKVFSAAGFKVVAQKSDGFFNTVFLCRLVSQAQVSPSPVTIDVDASSFSWLEELKGVLSSEQSNSESVWLKSMKKSDNGIIGMTNCLRREPNGSRLRCIFNASLSEKDSFEFSGEDLLAVYSKDLVMNVFRDGTWGSFRHILLNSESTSFVTEAAYVNVLTRGDLSSLRWIESPLKYFNEADNSTKELCTVAYTALNFRDIMLATGKLPPDAIPGDLASQDCLLGMEFSGHDASGRRVMGLLPAKGLATVVDAHKDYLWPVPDEWTLEQASTVPVAYATAFYALVVRGNIHSSETVLIHSGSGAVGQAAISIALSLGCRVLTTVGSASKRSYLQKRFPALGASSFADSRNSKFWRTILKATAGRGVDVVLNSLAEDKLQSSVRLMAQHGRFLEIGKYDLSNDTPLGMAIFLRNVAFHGILLDALFEPGNPDWKTVYNLVLEDIRTGVVQPLQTSVYDRDDVESAFRFMAQGKHIGKVVIKIRDEIDSASSSLLRVPAVPRVTCHPRRTYILVGGLGGFGLELAQWLVDRGARHLVLTSRGGVRNGYQDRRIRELRKLGVKVQVSTRNVCDADDALALINESGSGDVDGVGGVFNLAVVLSDGLTANQEVAQWKRVAEPKVVGTENLDIATRKLCGKSLDWFIVFSSVSCGRGNAGQGSYGYSNSVMERICEKRRRDGLPGMAIQWGAIGDVGVALNLLGGNQDVAIGGTLPQRIVSCLSTLDLLLCRQEPIVSSFVLAESLHGKSESSASGASLREAVAHILGIKDASSVNADLTLGDLGLDSLMGIEIKQMLERDYSITMDAKNIRALTFTQLDALSQPSGGAQAQAEKGSEDAAASAASTLVRYQLKHLLPTEHLVKMNSIDDSVSIPLFVVTPIDGSVLLLERVVSDLKVPVYGLQCTEHAPLTTVPDLASHYIKQIRAVRSEGPFQLVGYSFGACVAVEMALQLQNETTVSLLILLDGSHSFVASFTGNKKDRLTTETNEISSIETAAICAFISQLALRLDVSAAALSRVDVQQLGSDLLTKPDWNVRVSTAISALVSAGVAGRDSETLLSVAIRQYYQKLVIADQYQPATRLQSAKVTLVRASEGIRQVELLGEDYGLGSLSHAAVEVHVVNGSHEGFITDSESASKVASVISLALVS